MIFNLKDINFMLDIKKILLSGAKLRHFKKISDIGHI